MQKTFPVILLAAFLSIAVFGFMAMGEAQNGHTHGGCIAATAKGARSCQAAGEGAEALLFHIRTFKSFSQALLAGILVFAMFYFIARYGRLRLAEEAQSLAYHWLSAPAVMRFVQFWQGMRRRIMYWLALHESRADQAFMGA